MPAAVISKWAKAARLLGLLWLAIALFAAMADLLLTSGPPDPQAMFGGHFIALVMLWVGQLPAAVVIVCAIVAVVRGLMFADVSPGWLLIGIGLIGVAVGYGVLFAAFVR